MSLPPPPLAATPFRHAADADIFAIAAIDSFRRHADMPPFHAISAYLRQLSAADAAAIDADDAPHAPVAFRHAAMTLFAAAAIAYAITPFC